MVRQANEKPTLALHPDKGPVGDQRSLAAAEPSAVPGLLSGAIGTVWRDRLGTLFAHFRVELAAVK